MSIAPDAASGILPALLQKLLEQAGQGNAPNDYSAPNFGQSNIADATLAAQPRMQMPTQAMPTPQPVPEQPTAMPPPTGVHDFLRTLGLNLAANPIQVGHLRPRDAFLGNLLAGAANGYGAQTARTAAGEQQFNDQQRKDAASRAAAQLRQHQISIQRPKGVASQPLSPTQIFERNKAAAAGTAAGKGPAATPATGTQGDAQAIADAIESGKQAPDTKGLYRLAGPVRAELGRRGFDFTKAALDYQGVQKWLNSSNSPPQLRLVQAIDATYNMLDQIQTYSDQLQTLAPRGPSSWVNRGSLALAMQGAYGQDAAVVAKQMRDQMTLVAGEVAQVLSGGNSPLDKSLEASLQVLDDKRSPAQIAGTLANLRKDLAYRRNSIATAGPRSPSNVNTGGGISSISVGARKIPVGAGNNVRMRAPDGRTLSVPPADVARMKAAGATEF